MPKTKHKEILYGLILMFVSIIVVLGLFEIILRIANPSQEDVLDKWIPTNDARNYDNRPNYTYERDGVVYAINADGLREDVAHAKEKSGTTRIALLGDSVTFGMTVANNETFASLLEQKLTKPVEVLNFGVPGYDVASEIQVLRSKALSYGPDVVILNFVMNDIEPSTVLFKEDTEKICILPYISTKVSCAFKDFLRNIRVLDFIYNRIRTAFYSNVDDYYTISWQDKELYKQNIKTPLAEFKTICQTNNLRCGVVVFPLLQFNETYYRWEEQENNLLAELDALSLPYLALREEYRQYAPDELGGNSVDILHPNAVGHRIAADEIAIFIRESLLSK